MTTIDPTTSASRAQAAGAPITGAASDSIDKDAFLKLLVAQLRYQDPLKPADGTEFMAQTAQFHMAEKLEELSAQNADLLASQRTLAGTSLIGRTVSYATPEGIDRTGVVAGVKLGSDGPSLRIGDDDVPLSQVRSIAREATSTAAG